MYNNFHSQYVPFKMYTLLVYLLELHLFPPFHFANLLQKRARILIYSI